MRLLRFAGQNNGALAQNPAHQFAARHALRHYASNSVYTFIPKNGCSTMRLSLAIANGCIRDRSQHLWIHTNNETFAADLPSLATASFTFVILRDPFARLASVYLDKIVNRDREFWNLHDAIRRTADPDEITFRRFVEFLSELGVLAVNIHWRPQADFLVYHDYDLWVSLERFHEFVPKIEHKTGIRIEDARSLTQHGSDRFIKVDGEFHGDTAPAAIRSMQSQGVTPSHLSLYDEEIRLAVLDLYAKDHEIYGRRFPLS